MADTLFLKPGTDIAISASNQKTQRRVFPGELAWLFV